MKTGYAQQKIWIYFILTFALMVVIFFLYNSANSILDRQSKVGLYIFLEKFENSVEATKGSYGTVRNLTFFVGEDFDRICFSEYGKATTGGVLEPQIIDIIENGYQQNVFVLKGGKVFTHYIPGIIVENLSTTRFGCYNISRGYVNILLFGKGNGTVIGPPDLTFAYGSCVVKVPEVMVSGQLKPEIWNITQIYFRNDSSGKIVSACGPDGWVDVEVLV
jgi:hypothetical protein